MTSDIFTTEQTIKALRRRVVRERGRRSLAISLAVTAVLTFALLGFVFGIAGVRGDSMAPAIVNRDMLLFARVGGYGRGDVVLFSTVEETEENIKRIIAMPGETVFIDENGQVLVNGVAVGEPSSGQATLRKDGIEYPLMLAEDEYFVMGDSRGASLDSRNYGAIKAERIIGRVLAVLRLRDF
ncbi:MAG: signal peptidase I [Clostridium sp.]|nr:signal peptidase I [Clostridium sp.]